MKIGKVNVVISIVGLLAASLEGCEGQSCEDCPLCSTLSIDPLNAAQIDQVLSQQTLIQNIENNPSLLYNYENQVQVVTLTAKQELQMTRNFPQLFKSQETFLQQQETVGTITVQGEPNQGRRRHRTVTPSQRSCQPQFGSSPLILARKTTGEVVQIAQPSTGSTNQWLFEETCQTLNQTCGLAERHVPALFINLSDFNFDMADIILQCCVTLV